MAQLVRRVLSAIILSLAVLSFLVPSDWLPLSGAAISADVWLVNNASLPGFFLLFAVVGIFLLVPDIWCGASWTAARLTGSGPLTATFDQARLECREETMFDTGPRAVFFRLLLQNNTRHFKKNVNARLAEVVRLNDNRKQIVQVLLASVIHTSPPVTQFDLGPQAGQIIDCFYISENREIGPPLHNWPFGFPADMFASAGDYLFKIVIEADGSDPLELALKLEWAGDWKTASVILAD